MVFKKNPKQHLLSVLICAMVAIPVVCWPIGFGVTLSPAVLVSRAYDKTFPEEEIPEEEIPENPEIDPELIAQAIPEGQGAPALTEDGLIDVSQGVVAKATYSENSEIQKASNKYNDVPTFMVMQAFDEADLPIELLDTTKFAEVNEKVYIDATNSIIKETPRMDSNTLSTIARGTGVTRTGIGDTWSRIVTENGTEGYVITKTLSDKPVHIAIDRTVWVDCDSLSLREGPSSDSPYLGSLGRDQKLRCTEIVDKWFKVVTPNGNEGYVARSYTTETPPPTPTPVPTRAPASTRRNGGGGGGNSNNKTGKVASLPAIDGCNGQSIVSICEAMLGVDYVWCGESESGVDCSGLVVFSYRKIGISVPHFAQSITSCGINVAREDIAPGDVVCWNTGGGYCGHVGIYVGGGQVIHASNSRDKVCYGNVDMMPIVTIRRLVQ